MIDKFGNREGIRDPNCKKLNEKKYAAKQCIKPSFMYAYKYKYLVNEAGWCQF